MDLDDTSQFLPHTDIDWSLLFSPSEWYITPETIITYYKPLLASLGFSLACALVFLFARSKAGINKKTSFWRDMRFARLRFSDSWFLIVWLAMYVPLAIGAWLVYIENDEKWSRALTIYALHMLVNVLFPVSLWWVQDLSLALLNLLTLIGVAMFTTSQFGRHLYFASYINTPYLLFLLVYLIEFCYFWYLNEGQELMDIANLQAAKTVGVSLPAAAKAASSSGGVASDGTSGSPAARRRKRAGPPEHIKNKLKQRLQEAKREDSDDID